MEEGLGSDLFILFSLLNGGCGLFGSEIVLNVPNFIIIPQENGLYILSTLFD